MSAATNIEWTDATCIVDRDGRRVRVYQRLDPSRPGQQERRRKRAEGLRWCRGCRDWLASEDVNRQGVCAEHARAEYRASYARNPDAIRRRTRARKRGVAPLPAVAVECLTEQFEGFCAYCDAPATTWDHVIPIRVGGATEPGNIVPACRSCNSSKKASDVAVWLAGRAPKFQLLDVLALVA